MNVFYNLNWFILNLTNLYTIAYAHNFESINIKIELSNSKYQSLISICF